MLPPKYAVREVFQAAGNGALILTASSRLARVLTQEFNAFQRDQGHTAWRTADILPLRAYLRRYWREWILAGETTLALLDPMQERALWEQVIRESTDGDTLLRIPETAAAAATAWKVVQDYRLPLDGSFRANEDCSAFLGWASDFQQRCEAGRWITEAELPEFVVKLRPRPRPMIYLAGFEELTPQEERLMKSLGEFRFVSATQGRTEPVCLSYPDANAELAAAARQARSWLENDPGASIGIIVPSLDGIRSKVARIFRETFYPGKGPVGLRRGLPHFAGAFAGRLSSNSCRAINVGVCERPHTTFAGRSTSAVAVLKRR